LKSAGKDVICLEATSRAGGRVLTVHDPLSPVPIELGAEFVHGLPPATWELITKTGLLAYEHSSKVLHIDRGTILKNKVGALADKALSQMAKSRRKKDESLAAYLRRSRQPDRVKPWIVTHIEGFNAANQKRISVSSLIKDNKATEEIEGDRTFRILNGYDSVPLALLRAIPGYPSVVRFNSAVQQIKWRPGHVEVQYRSGSTNGAALLRCRKLVVTVSLGVLPPRGFLRFDPQPGETLDAAAGLELGQAYRVTFRFQTKFWEQAEEFKSAGFLISNDRDFRAWWTTNPVVSPILTAWSAGSAADQFHKLSSSQVANAALKSLGRILDRKVPQPEAIYFHNWHSDPFFGGAYSYVPVNGLPARETLARPVHETLFFAGEATNLKGHSATVHGAIESGQRVANLVLATSR
jgi:monoamine oxidase